jgi:hypothetical protein
MFYILYTVFTQLEGLLYLGFLANLIVSLRNAQKKISKQFFAQFFSHNSLQKSGNDKDWSILFPFPACSYGNICKEKVIEARSISYI